MIITTRIETMEVTR